MKRSPHCTVRRKSLAALRPSPQELGREMRLAAAMIWDTQGRISHEKAASFAGVGRIDFIDALAASNLPAFHVDVDDLMEEVELAHRAHREHLTAGLPRPSRSPGDTP